MRAWTWLASWRWLQSCKRERVVFVGGVGFFCGFVIGGRAWEIVIVGGVIGVFDEEGGNGNVAFGSFYPTQILSTCKWLFASVVKPYALMHLDKV